MSLAPSAAAWLLLALAPAPDQAAAAGRSVAEAGYQDIVVTARRRPERADEVPISLTAVDGEDLVRLQAAETPSLGKVVPSLVMTRTGAFTQPYLRGVGKRSTLGVENGVATYVDGVYLASSISALLDLRGGIDRIEVLNGPQGTLFGRNSTGGVIQVVTRDPDFASAAAVEAEAEIGSYGLVRQHFYASGGMDRVAGSIAAGFSSNGGYGRNLFTNRKDQGEVDHSLVVRSKWLWHPKPSIRLAVSADYQDVEQDFAKRPVEGYPPIGNPRLLGFRDGDQNSSNRFHFRYGGLSAKADVDAGPVVFTSLTALRRMNARYAQDIDLGPQLLLSGEPDARQEQFTQEFQLRPAESSNIDWIVGLYHIRLDERYDPTRFQYGGSYSQLLGGRTSQTLFSAGKVSAKAAYGEVTLPLGRATRVTAGLRYTAERRTVRARGERTFDNAPFVRPIPGLPLASEEPLRDEVKFDELSWRAAVERRFSDRWMAYVSASHGFQSGGWNLQSPQVPAFQPERIDSFEGGLKFGDRQALFVGDLSLFYYDYSDLQVSAFTPLGSVTTNATSARLYGIELQLDVQLDPATEARLGGQFLHTEFRSFPNATCTDYAPGAAYAPVVCDATGNELPFAPELKFNIGLVRRESLGSIGSLILAGNLSFNSGYFSEPDNVVRQGSFATLDGSVEWQLPGSGGVSLRFWGSNLTNTPYYDSLVTFPTAGVLQRPAAGRRVGLALVLGR